MKKSILLVVLLVTVALFGTFVLAGCDNAPKEGDATEAPAEATAEVTAEVSEETQEPEAVEEAADVPDYCVGYFERWAGGGEYQNILVLHTDGTFYYSKMNESAFTAGTWELVDGEKEYAYFENEGDEEEKTATADQYFVFNHYDGTVEEVAYANDMIYDVTVTGFKSDFEHAKDKTLAPEDETPVTVVEYMLEGDEYSTLQIQHNGYYADTINEYMEGTWTVEGNTFTLIPDGEDSTATLVTSDDGSAVYTALDGTESTLMLPVDDGPAVVMTFEGESLTMDVYSDGTCQILYGGSPAGAGTWSYANYAFSLTLEDVEVPVTMEEGTHAFVFDYSIGDGQLQDTLRVESSVWGTADLSGAAPQLSVTFTGQNNEKIVLECYDDGTCALIYTGMGTVAEGTWSYANYAMSITLGEEEMEVSMDEAHSFVFDINMSDGQLQDTLVATTDEWGHLAQ